MPKLAITISDKKKPVDNNGMIDHYVADTTSVSDSAKCYFETYPYKVQNLHWLIPNLKSLEFVGNELLRIHNRCYYPFGSPMDGRTFGSERYRYGFQGQEAENEISGMGNYSFFKYRISDNRLGRFFAVDPLSKEYPWNSNYAFSENRVIDGVELEGLEYQAVALVVPIEAGLILTGVISSGILLERAQNGDIKFNPDFEKEILKTSATLVSSVLIGAEMLKEAVRNPSYDHERNQGKRAENKAREGALGFTLAMNKIIEDMKVDYSGNNPKDPKYNTTFQKVVGSLALTSILIESHVNNTTSDLEKNNNKNQQKPVKTKK